MYKIGDKVEYCGLVSTVVSINERQRVMGIVYTQEEEQSAVVGFDSVKPYRTAHEKLIEMGYEEKIHDTVVKSDVESGRYKQYVKGSEVILIDVENRDFTKYILYNGDKGVSGVSWVNHKLSRILTQYLEEMK
jgi:hypothetical protein